MPRDTTGSADTATHAGRTRPAARRSPARVTRPGRSRTPIALLAAVVTVAAAIIGYGGWAVYQNARSWQDRAEDIDGLVNYREMDPKALTDTHVKGPLTYRMGPAVGGNHNINWQNCMGDVYAEPIAQEHAVHSLEHGAVWVTYRPGLPQAQIDVLAGKVRGREKMLMSPYDGLDAPISLQAWGYRLQIEHADDKRIDQFIKVMRVNASIEGPNASCSQGITATGTTPRDLPPPQ